MDSSLLTIVITTSAPAAASFGEDATAAPCSARGAALDAVRLNTVTGYPAFNRFEAIGAPIVPRPINPIFFKFVTIFQKN